MIYDVAVIGGGPGGYVAAIKAAQSGLKTVLFEKEKLGGVCLNKGCIPTKSLLKSASVYHSAKNAAAFGIQADSVAFDWAAVMAHKETVVNQLVSGIGMLLKSNGVKLVAAEVAIKGMGSIVADGREYSAKNIILAAGSQPVLPPIQGIESKAVITSDEMLRQPELPKSIVVVGGGVVGIEFAFLLNRFGVQVTVIEMLDRILCGADVDVIRAVTKDLVKAGIEIVTAAKVKSIDDGTVVYEKNRQEFSVTADKVLISVGRKPAADIVMLDRLDVAHKNGAIVTNERMQTNIPGIYAIGDVNGKSMLAHTASEEGIVAVENICGKDTKMKYSEIPQCVYIEPEIAWAGMTEQAAKEVGVDVQIGVFSMGSNGKSLIEGEKSGFVKFVADKKYGEILGAHMYCAHATDMIAEIVLAMKMECCIEDIAKCIHPHPTVSESVMEAANAVFGKAIHSVNNVCEEGNH